MVENQPWTPLQLEFWNRLLVLIKLEDKGRCLPEVPTMAAVDNAGEPSKTSQDFPTAKLYTQICFQVARALAVFLMVRQFLPGGLGQGGNVRIKCYGLGRCSRG